MKLRLRLGTICGAVSIGLIFGLSVVNASASPFTVNWEPAIGRGELSQRFPDGSSMTVRLSDGYPGYAGGVYIGSYGRSGISFVEPGHPAQNIWCAQDESLIDLSENKELNAGWSENFSSQKDPQKLYYCGGLVRQNDESVTILSANANSGYLLVKALVWQRGKKYLLVGTSIVNYGQETKHFDYWNGDDPWLGKYGDASGNVAWVNDKLIDTEKIVSGSDFSATGFFDSKGYRGLASVIELDPQTTPPTLLAIANGFSHSPSEVQPGRKLDSPKMRAINIGWKDVYLRPGAEMTMRYVMGMADTNGGLIITPEIERKDWNRLQNFLHDGFSSLACPQALLTRKSNDGFRFSREYLEVEGDSHSIAVNGTYFFLNASSTPVQGKVWYPFPVESGAGLPSSVTLDGRPVHYSAGGFPLILHLAPWQEKSLKISYHQGFENGVPRYILRSTRSWKSPLLFSKIVVKVPPGARPSGSGLPFFPLASEMRSRYFEFGQENFWPTSDLSIN